MEIATNNCSLWYYDTILLSKSHFATILSFGYHTSFEWIRRYKKQETVTTENTEDRERVIGEWEGRYSMIVITHVILPILFSNSTLKSLFPINILLWFSKGFYLFKKLNGQVGGPLRLKNLQKTKWFEY